MFKYLMITSVMMLSLKPDLLDLRFCLHINPTFPLEGIGSDIFYFSMVTTSEIPFRLVRWTAGNRWNSLSMFLTVW